MLLFLPLLSLLLIRNNHLWSIDHGHLLSSKGIKQRTDKSCKQRLNRWHIGIWIDD